MIKNGSGGASFRPSAELVTVFISNINLMNELLMRLRRFRGEEVDQQHKGPEHDVLGG